MMDIESMRNKTYLTHSHGSDYGVEEAEALKKVLANRAPTCGPEVNKFEEEFAQMTGSKYAFAVSSCVAGLHLALLSIDLKPGDEVLVPAMTFQATANVPDIQRCKVVFVEAKRTFNIDPAKIEEKITSRTKAIMPVHMCGQSCEMDKILEIAGKYNLIVIEDAAHATGGAYKGKMIGNISDFAAFSFQQSKNMSTLGEGGMLTTNSDRYASRIKNDRGNGDGGLNYRMTDAQAAVGRIQLRKLPAFIEARRKNSQYFYQNLKELEAIRLVEIIEDIVHTFHLCNIMINEEAVGIKRDDFIKKLDEKYGIGCIHQYSPAIPLRDYYRQKYGYQEGDFPVAEDLAKNVVTLPIAPRMTQNDLDYCIESIREVIKEKKQ